MRKLTKFRHIFNVAGEEEEDDFYEFIDDLTDKIDDIIDEIDDLYDEYKEAVDEINDDYASYSAPQIFSRPKKEEKPKERCIIKKILNIFYKDK